jgi:ATP-dependent Clp protease protease subunit
MKTKLTEVQSELIKKKIINLDANIDEKTFEYVKACFEILSIESCPDFTVWISSKGGDAEYGLMIYDLFRAYHGKKRGLIMGYAHSIASIILQACDTRYGLKNSKMRIHFIEQDGVATTTILNQKKLKKFIKDVKLDKKNFISIYKNKKITRSKLKKILHKDDRDLSMKEALSYGLIDKIIYGSFDSLS